MLVRELHLEYCPHCGRDLGAKMEEGIARGYCQFCDWTYYPRPAVAVGGIITFENKVLLVQRAREPYRGMWCLPAGFLEFGEGPLDTLRREIKEETGLAVLDAELFDIKLGNDDPRAPSQLVIFYKAVVAGNLVNDQEENLDCRFWETNQLPPIEQLAWQSHREVLKSLFG